MADGDVEVVLEGYEAWNRGDLQWMLDHASIEANRVEDIGDAVLALFTR